MTRTAVASIALISLPLGLLLQASAQPTPAFGVECGSLGLPDRQILIRTPSDPSGLRVDIATASPATRPDGAHWTVLRARAGTDSLSCRASDPASFILDLQHLGTGTVQVTVETAEPITFQAQTPDGQGRGTMGLGPEATGTFRW